MHDSNHLPDEVTAGAIAHMNADHAQNVLDYVHALAGLDWAEHASMTQIDRDGFALVAQAGARAETARIVFDEPVHDAQELRKAMVVLARRARERLALRDDTRYE